MVLHTLNERRWLILATAAIIIAVVTLRSAAQDDKYEATAKVLVGQTEAVEALFPGSAAGTDPDRVARTNVELIDDSAVADLVAQRLSADRTSSDLLDRVEA